MIGIGIWLAASLSGGTAVAPALVVAEAAPEAAAQVPSSREASLEILRHYFTFDVLLTRFIHAYLADTVAAKLASTPEGSDLLAQYPGIADAMVEAGSRAVALSYERSRPEIQKRLAEAFASISDFDLSQFAAIFEPNVAAMATISIPTFTAEMQLDQMIAALLQSEEARALDRATEERFVRFGASPSGRRMDSSIDQILAQIRRMSTALGTIGSDAIAAAHRGANRHVREHGGTLLPFPEAGLE